VGAGWSFLLLGFLPFEVKLPVQKPLAMGAPSDEELDAFLESWSALSIAWHLRWSKQLTTRITPN